MLTFELVSPAKQLASVEADAITVPGMLGDLTAMEGHAPFLTTLRPGFVVIRKGAEQSRFVITGGFAEISDDVVSVLAEEAADASAIDADWLDQRIADADAALEAASAETRQMALQKRNDLVSLKAIV